jgi:aspartate/methionine/tyrosine aminotransferase
LNTVRRGFGPKTRAVLIVSPNNPTGQFVAQSELDAIAALCQEHDAAVISDEVFADYELTPGASAGRGSIDGTDIFGFMLGGLSKTVGLPQAKLAWIALNGADAQVHEARAALELGCDTYLSVSTPIQSAAPALLERGSIVRDQIRERISSNYRTLRDLAIRVPACEVLRCEGGWSAVVRVPSLMSEDDLVLSLLVDDGVLVHPGYFFDFPSESFLILSLLAPLAVFVKGVTRVFRRFERQEAAT